MCTHGAGTDTHAGAHIQRYRHKRMDKTQTRAWTQTQPQTQTHAWRAQSAATERHPRRLTVEPPCRPPKHSSLPRRHQERCHTPRARGYRGMSPPGRTQIACTDPTAGVWWRRPTGALTAHAPCGTLQSTVRGSEPRHAAGARPPRPLQPAPRRGPMLSPLCSGLRTFPRT